MTGENSRPDVYCLMGPTASGKTAMALELVKRLPVQIISVDSAQVYRGMDIGTGKPDAATQKLAPHRLIDIKDPSEIYSASEFRHDALREISQVLAAGDIPLLVGGTMLYFKALRDGLADLPQADPDIRADIENLAREQGWEAVHARLGKVDPESAHRIHPNDPQRLQRALEVYLVTGRSMTELHREDSPGSTELPYKLHFLAIQPLSREQLHEQIALRFRQMLEQGLLEEVRQLHRRGDLHPMLPSIKSVGYRQVWQHLEGQLSYDDMVEKSIIATRQLAKRQLTWLRGWENLLSLNDPSANSIDKVLNYLTPGRI